MDARELHRGHALDPGLTRGGQGVANPSDRVVVGERHHRHPGRRSGPRDVGRGELAVGDGGMRLEIDHRPIHSNPRELLTSNATIDG